MSRVGIFTKGKKYSKHVVLIVCFAPVPPHTYGEALITMTAPALQCQQRLDCGLADMMSRYLSRVLDYFIIKITIISHFG